MGGLVPLRRCGEPKLERFHLTIHGILLTSWFKTHGGLVTPYGDIHCINVISSNGVPDGTKPLPDVDFSLLRYYGLHPRTISCRLLKLLLRIVGLKIILFKSVTVPRGYLTLDKDGCDPADYNSKSHSLNENMWFFLQNFCSISLYDVCR